MVKHTGSFSISQKPCQLRLSSMVAATEASLGKTRSCSSGSPLEVLPLALTFLLLEARVAMVASGTRARHRRFRRNVGEVPMRWKMGDGRQ